MIEFSWYFLHNQLFLFFSIFIHKFYYFFFNYKIIGTAYINVSVHIYWFKLLFNFIKSIYIFTTFFMFNYYYSTHSIFIVVFLSLLSWLNYDTSLLLSLSLITTSSFEFFFRQSRIPWRITPTRLSSAVRWGSQSTGVMGSVAIESRMDSERRLPLWNLERKLKKNKGKKS